MIARGTRWLATLSIACRWDLGHPQLIPMFASDERVSAHGSENSAGKEKTGNKISGGVKKSAEGRNLLGVLKYSSKALSERMKIMFFL